MEIPNGTGTTGTYIDLYLRDLGRLVDAGERQPITLRLYEDSARHHLVLLRECPLELLTVAQLREWHFTVAQMARNSGWHTVKTRRAVLRLLACELADLESVDLSSECDWMLGSADEHEAVEQALTATGSLAGAAIHLGISFRELKIRIIRNRVEWPRTGVRRG